MLYRRGRRHTYACRARPPATGERCFASSKPVGRALSRMLHLTQSLVTCSSEREPRHAGPTDSDTARRPVRAVETPRRDVSDRECRGSHGNETRRPLLGAGDAHASAQSVHQPSPCRVRVRGREAGCGDGVAGGEPFEEVLLRVILAEGVGSGASAGVYPGVYPASMVVGIGWSLLATDTLPAAALTASVPDSACTLLPSTCTASLLGSMTAFPGLCRMRLHLLHARHVRAGGPPNGAGQSPRRTCRERTRCLRPPPCVAAPSHARRRPLARHRRPYRRGVRRHGQWPGAVPRSPIGSGRTRPLALPAAREPRRAGATERAQWTLGFRERVAG